MNKVPETVIQTVATKQDFDVLSAAKEIEKDNPEPCMVVALNVYKKKDITAINDILNLQINENEKLNKLEPYSIGTTLLPINKFVALLKSQTTKNLKQETIDRINSIIKDNSNLANLSDLSSMLKLATLEFGDNLVIIKDTSALDIIAYKYRLDNNYPTSAKKDMKLNKQAKQTLLSYYLGKQTNIDNTCKFSGLMVTEFVIYFYVALALIYCCTIIWLVYDTLRKDEGLIRLENCIWILLMIITLACLICMGFSSTYNWFIYVAIAPAAFCGFFISIIYFVNLYYRKLLLIL